MFAETNFLKHMQETPNRNIDEMIKSLESQNSMLKKVIKHMKDKNFPLIDNEEDIRKLINNLVSLDFDKK
jgi:predicted RNase H-like nuclease (RuvC/YqgF family)